MVYILCSSTDAYCPPCCAMLASLFYNNPDCDFHVYWLTMGLNEQSKVNISTLSEQFKYPIEVLTVQDQMIDQLPITNKRSLPKETYLRFFGLGLIPQHVNKILNLDCDMIVRASIADLWNIDLRNNILGMVECLPSQNEEIGNRLGYPAWEYGYYNAGMVLINLKLWRENNIQERLFQWIDLNKDKMRLYEQDAINALLYGKIQRLSIKWNVCPECFHSPQILIESYRLELPLYISNPPIVHYVGTIKPWHLECEHPFATEYDKYLAMTPYKEMSKTSFFKSYWEKRKFYLKKEIKKWLVKLGIK